MLLVDLSELSAAQTEVLGITPDTCTIARPGSAVSDGAGGYTETYTNVATNVACNVFPARGLSSLAEDIQQNEQARVIGQWLIQLPIGTSVTVRDRITITASGRVYEVVDTEFGESWNIVLTAKCILLD